MCGQVVRQWDGSGGSTVIGPDRHPNGADALALVQRLNGAIDVLVTDIRMPGIDGFQLAEAVRASYPAIPVVYISGYCSQREMDKYNHPDRGQVFVAKPFLWKTLIEAVQCVMTARRSRWASGAGSSD